MDTTTALSLVKARLNRLAGDTTLDEYLTTRIQAAEAKLNSMMPSALQSESTEDLMLLVDYTVWQYQSRDKTGGDPEWLRMRLRERYLKKVTA